MALLHLQQYGMNRLPEFVLEAFLPYRLSVLSDQVSREFSTVYRAKFGLSVPEWRVIAHLSQTKKPVSVREIYRRVNMDKSKVSRASTRLENRGFLLKTKNKADGRLVELSLSAQGHALVSELAPVALAFEQDFLSRLGTLESPFLSGLDKLLEPNSEKHRKDYND